MAVAATRRVPVKSDAGVLGFEVAGRVGVGHPLARSRGDRVVRIPFSTVPLLGRVAGEPIRRPCWKRPCPACGLSVCDAQDAGGDVDDQRCPASRFLRADHPVAAVQVQVDDLRNWSKGSFAGRRHRRCPRRR